MRTSSIDQFTMVALLVFGSLSACGSDSTGLSENDLPDGGVGVDTAGPIYVLPNDPTSTVASDAGGVSVPPILKAGVDPTIFLPVLVAGYHPTAEELATSGKACSSDADCATSGGQVVFHCSTPYYGQAQCQGVFPPGDQILPGVAPSCVYYECPSGYQCETEVETHSVTCLAGQSGGQNGKPTVGQDGGQSGKQTGKPGGGQDGV
jgi:hypothetical protein